MLKPGRLKPGRLKHTAYLPVYHSISMFSFMRQLLPCQLYPNQPRSVTSSDLLNLATKRKMIGLMPTVTRRLLKVKEELLKEVKRMAEDYFSPEAETHLAIIRNMKNVYQDEIEDFVELYKEVLENPKVLEGWTQEVRNIARELRQYTDRIKTRAFQVSVPAGRASKPVHMKSFAVLERAAQNQASNWLKATLEAAEEIIKVEQKEVQLGESLFQSSDVVPDDTLPASRWLDATEENFNQDVDTPQLSIQESLELDQPDPEPPDWDSQIAVKSEDMPVSTSDSEQSLHSLETDEKPTETPDIEINISGEKDIQNVEPFVGIIEMDQSQYTNGNITILIGRDAVSQDVSGSGDPCTGAEADGQVANIDHIVRVKKQSDRGYFKISFQKCVNKMYKINGGDKFAAKIKKPPDIDGDLVENDHDGDQVSLDPPPFRVKKPPDKPFVG